jgi:hypothetical protein
VGTHARQLAPNGSTQTSDDETLYDCKYPGASGQATLEAKRRGTLGSVSYGCFLRALRTYVFVWKRWQASQMTKRFLARSSIPILRPNTLIRDLETIDVSVNWLLVGAADIGAEFNFQDHG